MTAQLGILSRSACRALVGLCAAILLGTLFSAPAAATLVINLRFNDAGAGGTTTMDLSAMSPGQTVTVQVWATVNGANTNLTDDGLSGTFFGITSAATTAFLGGDLTSGGNLAPFSAGPPDGFPGLFADANADTVDDWRGALTTNAGNWPKASAGSSTTIVTGGATGHANVSNPTAWDFHIADAVFTIGSISSPPATQNILQFNASVLGNLGVASNPGKASWREDNVAKTGTATLPSAGTGVTFTYSVVGGNPDIDPTPTSLNFGNLLLNAALPPSQNVTLTNNGTASGTYGTSPTGVAVVTSGGSGSINASANTLMGVGLAAGTTTTYGSNKPGTVVVSTTGDPDAAAVDTVSVTVTVGEAATAGTSFGAALSGVVGAAGAYNGLASRTTLGGGNAGSEAMLLSGSNATGAGETVSMRWRQRTLNESTSPTSPPLPISNAGDPAPLISDVVELTGLDYTGAGDAAGRTDPYVLQMTYNENLLVGGPGTEAAKATAGSIFPGWLDPNGAGPSVALWRLAVAGNFANDAGALFNFQGSYAAAGSPSTIGSWGVDVAANTVWAVLDHASEFAVVPEPSSIALFGLGALGLTLGIRRRRS